MFTLKQYQQRTLDTLTSFLKKARIFGAETAFEEYAAMPNKTYEPIAELPLTPYICLRLPTGGGKTYLAANAVKVAAQNYLDKDFPIVLWLTPTTTIKEQTIETLKNSSHPNREILDETFAGNVEIYDISEFERIKPQDIKANVCIIAATIQSFRVDKTEGRLIYSHNENLETHFVNILDNKPLSLERIEDSRPDSGKIKCSFANLLNIHNPLVIVDEAHNASTKLSYKVMERVNPACIIEFTATPAANSNVLVKVSAMELKAEEMIKLPIILKENQTWEESLADSVLMRRKLAETAIKDEHYIRPIVLIQAENENREITVDVIKKYLMENEKIEPEQIAIATGEQRELDNIDILSKDCKIQYIITKQALKEGWDCPFAYIFCSAASTKSAKDVEQLLGRVLRMPYAAKRNDEDLNKAYAFVSRSCWTNSVSFLQDKLVRMGFENWEAENALQANLMLDAGKIQNRNEFSFTAKLDTSYFAQTEIKILELRENQNGYAVMKLSKDTPRELFEKIQTNLPEADKKVFKNIADFISKASILSPAQRGEEISVPQLCLNISGEWEAVTDKEQYLPDGWNLLDCKAELSPSEFSIENKGKIFEIDINDNKITNRYIQETLTIDLDNLESDWTNSELSRWLDKNIRQPDIEQPILLEFLRKMIEYLNLTRNIPLTSLIRTKFILAEVINNKIGKYRTEAYVKAYRDLFVSLSQNIETKSESSFLFKFGQEYQPLSIYEGTTKFNKHLYEHIGAMNKEEENCAAVIDSLEEVKYWVRNIERSNYSFFLPTSTDRFYPDFIALLTDGRILAVEYKGGHLLSTDDTKEKENIGRLWQEKSGGKCLFMLSSKENLERQIIDKIKEE
ncbi:DEAD/DEAH box helicase [Candidatus Endomicrobiellum trichonymphae]|uniref:DEAD/DEAH box helicase n=1 Tax=Endomicrobium trichonymphae TaxID=1408204 RepID=UPI00086496B9|nr:DEAD/DEAH box helicase family protein [Candidatus Endomicrobium trichonymphae]BAV58962.1 type III restriction enzyme, res subunit [Candidatus Endomicrobium trichonymphae]